MRLLMSAIGKLSLSYLFVTLSTMSASPFDLNAGLEAFKRKDYVAAIREWQPPANQNDATANYYMGILYQKIGKRGEAENSKCIAGLLGNKDAIRDLITHYAKRNDFLAVHWCSVLELSSDKPESCKYPEKRLSRKDPSLFIEAQRITDTRGINWHGTTHEYTSASCYLMAAQTDEQRDSAQHWIEQIQQQNRAFTFQVKSPSQSPTAPALVSDTAKIKTEINNIETSGHYQALPSPQASPIIGPNKSGTIVRNIQNDTAYKLTVLFDGPIIQEVAMAPGESRDLSLPIGSYRVAARTESPNVLPFFGVQSYESGRSYQSVFYIH